MTLSQAEKVNARFQPILETFLESPAMIEHRDGKTTLNEYRSFLRQVYYYVRENPQLQALATVYFRGRQRDLVRNFYQHAASETGHEQLALNDFATLGGDPANVPYENPLPATTALTSFAFYQIYNLNPIGYLGYLYFLEFVPTSFAGEVMASNLLKMGADENSMTFLRDHMEIDQGHNRLMKSYIEQLIVTDEELDTITYAMETTGFLYAQMMQCAIEDARQPSKRSWNWVELNADRKSPAAGAMQVA